MQDVRCHNLSLLPAFYAHLLRYTFIQSVKLKIMPDAAYTRLDSQNFIYDVAGGEIAFCVHALLFGYTQKSESTHACNKAKYVWQFPWNLCVLVIISLLIAWKNMKKTKRKDGTVNCFWLSWFTILRSGWRKNTQKFYKKLITFPKRLIAI